MRETIMMSIITIKEGIKNKLFYASLIAVAFLILFSAFLTKISLENPFKTFNAFSFFFVKIVSLLSILFLLLYNLYSDRERKTIHIYLSHLKKRRSYLRGKFLGFIFLYACFILTSLLLTHALAVLWSFSKASLISEFFREFFTLLLNFALLLSVSLLLYAILSSSLLINFIICLSIFLAGNMTTEAYIFTLTIKAPLYLRLLSASAYYLLPNFTLIRETNLIESALPYALSYSVCMEIFAEILFEKRDIP